MDIYIYLSEHYVNGFWYNVKLQAKSKPINNPQQHDLEHDNLQFQLW